MDGESVKEEVGLGITEVDRTKGVPLQPFSFGVIVKVMVAFGHTKLFNGVDIPPPIARFVPD